jgi:hypothetical protein
MFCLRLIANPTLFGSYSAFPPKGSPVSRLFLVSCCSQYTGDFCKMVMGFCMVLVLKGMHLVVHKYAHSHTKGKRPFWSVVADETMSKIHRLLTAISCTADYLSFVTPS